ncbi:ABC transporter ATP-binding protein [Shimia abyssi]|uniref:Iron complex transport system ATP-binding protein n=1 Tax=Shimia abyssi TaxID=1662395 RepID=A0A2P8F9S4_9RHOB|nr:ABC transporter ATP-binding protein [Shimia abyssi]PSL18476.1 iron complex transport system ATP-binding protein [Shimia abyssi]
MSAAELQVKDVSWQAGTDGQPILHPVSFHLKAGRILGIVGPNGAGKSTLLRTLYRYHKPSGGRVLIDGQDIWQMAPREAARTVAAVLQEQSNDFALTVRDVVTLGRLPHRLGFSTPGRRCGEIVEDVLERTDLTRLADRSIGTLSGGERQRAMVARAVAQAPRVIVLDEPTNHLDIHHQLELLELVRQLGMTVVVSLHDLNVASSFCDDILVLQNGHCRAFGPPEEVLTEPLVSGAFHVMAQLETLSRSQSRHFSFQRNS